MVNRAIKRLTDELGCAGEGALHRWSIPDPRGGGRVINVYICEADPPGSAQAWVFDPGRGNEGIRRLLLRTPDDVDRFVSSVKRRGSVGARRRRRP